MLAANGKEAWIGKLLDKKKSSEKTIEEKEE